MSAPPPRPPRWIDYVPLEDVKPALRNAREHDIPALVALIRRFGFVAPMIRDERTGRLVAGHGKWASLIVARAAGEYTPDGVLIAEDGAWLVPVVAGWSSRNDDEAEAYVIADNRAGDLSTYDERMYAAMLDDLQSTDPDLFEVLAYSEEEMDALIEAAPLDLHPDDVLDREEAPGHEDDDDLDPDPATTPPEQEGLVRCPECGHHFTPPGRP